MTLLENLKLCPKKLNVNLNLDFVPIVNYGLWRENSNYPFENASKVQSMKCTQRYLMFEIHATFLPSPIS